MSGFANNFGMNGGHSAAAANSLWQPRQFGGPGAVVSSSTAAAAHHQAAAAAAAQGHGHQDSRVAEKLVSELQVSLISIKNESEKRRRSCFRQVVGRINIKSRKTLLTYVQQRGRNVTDDFNPPFSWHSFFSFRIKLVTLVFSHVS